MTTDDDVRVFRAALDDTAPLKQDRVMPHRRRPRPLPTQSRRDEAEVMANLLHGGPDLASIETGEELVFARPGVRASVMRKLRRGEYSVSAELDLHGHNVEQARAALGRFLIAASGSRQCCVRVIHGKGLRSPGKRPVLKARVYNWLRRRDEVIAFSSARPVDGGTGAIYVLLKPR